MKARVPERIRGAGLLAFLGLLGLLGFGLILGRALAALDDGACAPSRALEIGAVSTLAEGAAPEAGESPSLVVSDSASASSRPTLPIGASTPGAPDSLLVGAAGHHPAILVGEKLTFTVRYGLIRAGTAVMEVSGPKRVYGHPAYQVVSTAASNSMFDGIYRVRDRVLSVMDAETLESIYFEKHLREGRYRADSRVRFDRERGRAVYHDNRESPIEPGTYDVLAAFYRVRTLPLRPGETFYLTSHDNRKNYPLKVVVTGRERVEVPAGSFDCFVLEPALRSGAFFKNEGRLTIWITDDERRMPVLMRSKLPIGAISVELIEAQRPEAANPSETKAAEPTG